MVGTGLKAAAKLTFSVSEKAAEVGRPLIPVAKASAVLPLGAVTTNETMKAVSRRRAAIALLPSKTYTVDGGTTPSVAVTAAINAVAAGGSKLAAV